MYPYHGFLNKVPHQQAGYSFGLGIKVWLLGLLGLRFGLSCYPHVSPELQGP